MVSRRQQGRVERCLYRLPRHKIKSVINGVTIADYDGAGRLNDKAHQSHNVGMKGQIGLQIHPGGELLIRFKDILVRPLK